jgi:hypothetical protein
MLPADIVGLKKQRRYERLAGIINRRNPGWIMHCFLNDYFVGNATLSFM